MGLALAAITIAAAASHAAAAPPSPPLFSWSTVVNNTDFMPTKGCEQDITKCRLFNSYNQPSVNRDGLVVIRARSRGGEGDTGGHEEEPEAGATVTSADGTEHENQPVHGIYTRDMSVAGSPIIRILDRKTEVPQPNNAHYPPSNPELTTFIETPSFPRIDRESATIATRANHPPLWIYGSEGNETRVGTTGIYTNPFGDLIAGATKLGAVTGFEFFAVPGLDPPVMFDVFPGAPAVTGGSTIVFKGNYTVGSVGRTGVFYRDLEDEDVNGGPGGGTNPVVLIANNTDTLIPGTSKVFGSTSPPSAANGLAVFAGFDNEENPTLGGIYLAPIEEYDPGTNQPDLTTLVRIGDQVPGERKGAVFNRLGEGVAFDGRYVAFWGAWGAMRTIRLHCPAEGNKDRIAFCLTQCPEPQGCSAKAPVSQGIFLHDIGAKTTQAVAKAPTQYGDFLFWNFSGMVPGVGGGEDGSEEDGEPARWRSSAFVAVSGTRTAFKAISGNLAGVYLSLTPGQTAVTVVDNRTDGQVLDPKAPAGSKVTEVGIERESLRGNWLAVSAKMEVEGSTEDEDGMAGVYITQLPPR
ncbi:MAG: hypothetical protein MUE60_15045 [Candidatus Eisenbacteria bacterium]|nr:hypothetical protein [Candidatus Eisenbacteria bacterium]